MRKIICSIVCLAFLSLACLGTSAVEAVIIEISPTWTATLTNVPRGEAATLTPTPGVEDVRGVCAMVVAESSLHLRNGPSSDDIVLTWLKRGDVVEVVDDHALQWWRVRFDGVEGYAHAAFLALVECEVRDE